MVQCEPADHDKNAPASPPACRRSRSAREAASSHFRCGACFSSAAQIAVETISTTFAEEGVKLTPEVSFALRDLETALVQGLGKPELNRARDLFRSFRAHFAHSQDSGAVVMTNLSLAGLRIDASDQAKPLVPSRRTRCMEDLSVRLLQPVHRKRYREEWRAEILSLPRRDQAPYALRLLSRAWFLRRELSDKPSRNPRSIVLIVGVAVPGADAIAAVCGLDWPAAVVGGGWTLGLMWIVASKDRTQRLLTLIRAAARSSKVPTPK